MASLSKMRLDKRVPEPAIRSNKTILFPVGERSSSFRSSRRPETVSRLLITTSTSVTLPSVLEITRGMSVVCSVTVSVFRESCHSAKYPMSDPARSDIINFQSPTGFDPTIAPLLTTNCSLIISSMPPRARFKRTWL